MKFKVGDIIKPIKGKKTSNRRGIKYIFKAKVTRLGLSSYGKAYIDIEVLEGKSDKYDGTPGRKMSLYEDAFELYDACGDNYEIY